MLPIFTTLSMPTAGKYSYCEHSGKTRLLLMDRTTQYDDRDGEIFKNGIDKIFNSLATGERLVVHTITNDASSSGKVFDSCMPGCPKSTGLGGWLSGKCSSGMARADRLSFTQQLINSLIPLIDNEQKFTRSAITQTIAVLARTYSEGSSLSQLTVFSDLLENSGQIPWPGIIENAPEELFQQISLSDGAAPLDGVEVRVFGFGRLHDAGRSGIPPRQYRAIVGFWREYFRYEGASNVRIQQWY